MMWWKNRCLLIIFVVMGLGFGKLYAPIHAIPTFAQFFNKSDYIVKGKVESVKDGNLIPEWRNPYKLPLIEKIYHFHVTSSLKGNIPGNTTIQITGYAIKPKMRNGIFGGPEFASMSTGEIGMIGLNKYKWYSLTNFRFAGDDLYSDTWGMKYPIAEANLNVDAPAGTANEKIIWEFTQNYEKGNIKEALAANDVYMFYGMTSEFPMDTRKVLKIYLDMYKKSINPKRDVLAIALYYTGDTTGLSDILRNAEDSTSELYHPSYKSLCGFGASTTDERIIRVVLKGIYSRDKEILQFCENYLEYHFDSPRVMEAIVKISLNPMEYKSINISYILGRAKAKITPTQKKEIKKTCLRIIENGDNEGKRIGIHMLAWTGDTSDIPMLARFLEVDPKKEMGGHYNPNGRVRASAIQTMMDLGGPKTLPIIIKGLRFPDWDTQVKTVQVLNYKTGMNFGYDITQKASAEKQKEALEKYINWWETRGKYIDWEKETVKQYSGNK